MFELNLRESTGKITEQFRRAKYPTAHTDILLIQSFVIYALGLEMAEMVLDHSGSMIMIRIHSSLDVEIEVMRAPRLDPYERIIKMMLNPFLLVQ